MKIAFGSHHYLLDAFANLLVGSRLQRIERREVRGERGVLQCDRGLEIFLQTARLIHSGEELGLGEKHVTVF